MSGKPLPMEVLAEKHELPELERMLDEVRARGRRIQGLLVVLFGACIGFGAALPGIGDGLFATYWYRAIVIIALLLPAWPVVLVIRWARHREDLESACRFKRKLMELRASEQR